MIYSSNILAKTCIFGRNSLFWAKIMFWPKFLFGQNFGFYGGASFGFGLSAKILFCLTTSLKSAHCILKLFACKRWLSLLLSTILNMARMTSLSQEAVLSSTGLPVTILQRTRFTDSWNMLLMWRTPLFAFVSDCTWEMFYRLSRF